MLYVSTRNTNDTYTAYRALHETQAPDGGFYVPFRLPVFTHEECTSMRNQTCGETVAQLLNLFFGLRLSALDVELVIGKTPFKPVTMQHRIAVMECWRNPEASFSYLLKTLYGLMTGEEKIPVGWPCVAIEIALLFGMYTTMDDTMITFDISVTSCDYADLAALSYAKKMGLPVNMAICTCGEDSAFWDLINKGEYSATAKVSIADRPDYMECCLFSLLGNHVISHYANAVNERSGFYIDDEQKCLLNSDLYAAVVSADRADVIAANVFRTNGYMLDADSALAYGGLQDYRADTGAGMQTLILVKKRPVRMKE